MQGQELKLPREQNKNKCAQIWKNNKNTEVQPKLSGSYKKTCSRVVKSNNGDFSQLPDLLPVAKFISIL